MSSKELQHRIADWLRFIARAASVFVIAIALFYIFAAIMMISGSDSPVFPKMLFSFRGTDLHHRGVAFGLEA